MDVAPVREYEGERRMTGRTRVIEVPESRRVVAMREYYTDEAGNYAPQEYLVPPGGPVDAFHYAPPLAPMPVGALAPPHVYYPALEATEVGAAPPSPGAPGYALPGYQQVPAGFMGTALGPEYSPVAWAQPRVEYTSYPDGHWPESPPVTAPPPGVRPPLPGRKPAPRAAPRRRQRVLGEEPRGRHRSPSPPRPPLSKTKAINDDLYGRLCKVRSASPRPRTPSPPRPKKVVVAPRPVVVVSPASKPPPPPPPPPRAARRGRSTSRSRTVPALPAPPQATPRVRSVSPAPRPLQLSSSTRQPPNRQGPPSPAPARFRPTVHEGPDPDYMLPTAASRIRAESPSPPPAEPPRPRAAADSPWVERLYEVRTGPGRGTSFLKKRTWDPQKVAEWRRNSTFRSMPPKDAEPRPPRPLRIPPEVEGHTIYRGPPDCDVGDRMLDPDVIKALKRSPMHPDLIKQWLERYCYDLTDEWLQHWLEAWENEERDLSSEEEEEDCGEQPVGSARLPRTTGRHKALLIGCGYPGTALQLKSPANDVKYLTSFLSRFGYRPKNTQVLVDDGESVAPTRNNMLDGMRELVAGARPGDSLFFFFSGYGRGNRLPGDSETYLEGTTLCPTDWQDSGLVEDDVLYELMAYPLPRGVKLTCVIDCHRHACGLDLPFEYEQVSGGLVCTNPVDLIKADVLLFSGGVNIHLPAAAPVPLDPRKPNDAKGVDAKSPMLRAFVHAILHASHNPPTLLDVVQGMRAFVGAANCQQLPTLTASRGYTLAQPFAP